MRLVARGGVPRHKVCASLVSFVIVGQLLGFSIVLSHL